MDKVSVNCTLNGHLTCNQISNLYPLSAQVVSPDSAPHVIDRDNSGLSCSVCLKCWSTCYLVVWNTHKSSR